MKKLFSLLLVLCMILSLCACGASEPATQSALPDSQSAATAADSSDISEPAGSSAPAEEETEAAAPPVYYYQEEKALLTRKEVHYSGHLITSDPALGLKLDSVTEYSYDELGNRSEKTTYVTGYEFQSAESIRDLYDQDGNERDDLSYEYDASGALVRVSQRYTESNKFYSVSELENGLVVRRMVKFNPDLFGSDALEAEHLFTYDSEGHVLSRDSTYYFSEFYGVFYTNPNHDLYEYNGEGCLTHWNYEGGFSSDKGDFRYEYDAAGELIRMTSELNGEGTEILELHRDSEERVTDSVLTSSDGTVLTHIYSYDEQGRILSDDVTGGKNELSFRLEYDEEGYPLSMTRYVDGKPDKTVNYKYTVDEYGFRTMTYKPTFDEAHLRGGDWDKSFLEEETNLKNEDRIRDGNIQWSQHHDFIIAGTHVRYSQTRVDYTYEMRTVRVPVDPAYVEPISGIEDVYPDLKGSYGGLKVPTPDGSQELLSIQMDFNSPIVLNLQSFIVFDAYGNPAGIVSRLENNTLYDNVNYEFDEQGRVIQGTQEDWGWDFQFYYSEDGRSYTVKDIDEGELSEWTESVEDYSLPELVRSTIADTTDLTCEFTEEGLLASSSYANRLPHIYSYSYEPGEDGILARVRATVDGSNAGIFLAFDEHGYLSSYTRAGGYTYGDLDFEYIYGPAAG